MNEISAVAVRTLFIHVTPMLHWNRNQSIDFGFYISVAFIRYGWNFRSGRSQTFFRIAVLKVFAKIYRKTSVMEPFFSNVAKRSLQRGINLPILFHLPILVIFLIVGYHLTSPFTRTYCGWEQSLYWKLKLKQNKCLE